MAMTTTAVRYHETGGPEVLRVEEVEVPEPGPGQALVRHTAIGVNFRDIYHRIGDIPAELPAVIGSEGAGVIEAVGPDTLDFKPGDRVSHCAVLGSYAERMVIDARRLVTIPDGVSEEQAAASTLRGLPRITSSIRPTRCSRATQSWSTPRPAAWASCSASGRSISAPP
jgi:NADPH2:quinone reductase